MDIIESWNGWDWQLRNDERKLYISKTYSEFLKQANWSGEKGGYARSSQTEGESSFFGTRSYQEANDLAINGWKEGLNKLEKFKNNNKDYLEKAKPIQLCQPIYQISGSYVDIGRYLAEQPDCMVFNQVNLIPKNVTILCRLGFCGGSSSSEYFAYGSKILSIIDFYEKQNVRVRLIARNVSVRGDNRVVTDIEIKDFSEFVDMNKLIFTLCHPAFQRRILWSFRESLPTEVVYEMGYHSNSSYGSSMDLTITEEEEKYLCIDSSNSYYFSDSEKLIDNLNAKVNQDV